MIWLIILIAVVGGLLFLWFHFNKVGIAELTALETRIVALENLFSRGMTQAVTQKAPSPQPVPTPVEPAA